MKAYARRYKVLPEIWASTYYDATHPIARAIQAAGSTDAERLRAAFFALRFSGVLADYRCDPTGDCNHQIHIVTVRRSTPAWVTTIKF